MNRIYYVITCIFIISSSTAISQDQIEYNYEIVNVLIENQQISSLAKGAYPIIDYTKNQNEFNYIVSQTSEKSLNILVDTIYMKEQLNSKKYVKWDKSRIIKKVHLKRKAVDYISIPLFLNRDNSACIIYHRQYVGPLDASAFYEIYKKENNTWKSVQLLLLWMS